MLDEEGDGDKVRESVGSLVEPVSNVLLVSIVSSVELNSIAELDLISELDVVASMLEAKVDDDFVDEVSTSVDWEKSLTIDEVDKEVAVAVVEKLYSSEELLSRASELMLDVLTTDSLVYGVDVGMTGLVSMSLDADEGDDDETLVGMLVDSSVFRLLNCELLELDDRADDVVDGKVVICKEVKLDVEISRGELLDI